MWLKVASSNSNPKQICYYFLDKLEELSGIEIMLACSKLERELNNYCDYFLYRVSSCCKV